MVERIRQLFMDEEGATMVEYALMVALIAVIALLAVKTLGGKVNNTFTEVGNAVQ